MIDVYPKDSQFVMEHWTDLKQELSIAFSTSQFNGDYTVDDVLNDIEGTLSKNSAPRVYQHLLAFQDNATIVGALFSIDLKNKPQKQDCSTGWFYTSAGLSKDARKETATALIERLHELAKASGYKRIMTMIGTKAGEKFLTEKFGYIWSPRKALWQCDL
jgi:hypothetical protein